MFHCLEIPSLILNEVIEHARTELPNECCGLLAGQVADGVAIATARFAIRNERASPREYASHPRDMLDAFRSMRERALELLAIYHSHPHTEPIPSHRDLEHNTYGESVAHLIVSLASADPALQAWRLGESDYSPISIRESV